MYLCELCFMLAFYTNKISRIMTKQSDFFLKLSYKKYIYNFDQRQKSVNTRKNNSCEQGTDLQTRKQRNNNFTKNILFSWWTIVFLVKLLFRCFWFCNSIPRSNCCSMIMEIFDRLANIRPHLTNMWPLDRDGFEFWPKTNWNLLDRVLQRDV